jgi:hypothetical protein
VWFHKEVSRYDGSGKKEKEASGVTNVIDGTNSPRESDKCEDRVYVEGKLGSITTCTGEQSYKSVNASDLV